MDKGLSSNEVIERINEGKVNNINNGKTKSIKEIILTNIFTYFNILNILLASAIIISGILFKHFFDSFKNCLFLGVVISNTVISIVQEVMAKKTIDKLSVLSNVKAKVIRDGNEQLIEKEEIVLDDTIIYEIGSQVVVDAEIMKGSVEVNESFITGESKTITKKKGDIITSGSFVVSGNCVAKVIHVGNDNYINTISKEAKTMENNKSIIFNSFEKLVRILSYVILPLGVLLFLNQYVYLKEPLYDAIVGTVAALIGMIPEGLVLLTSSVMAVSVVKLSREKVLVQQLYCIETLARVNVICLDKTGTITTGNMKVFDIINKNISKSELEFLLSKIVAAFKDNSPTFEALRNKYKKDVNISVGDMIPFSSDRKYSACVIDDVAYYIGAPEFILKEKFNDQEIIDKQNDYRVLVLVHTKTLDKEIINPIIDGYILIEDEIRREAKDTLNYFKEQGVKVKIISGDNFNTVLKIAEKVGLKNLKGIDTTTLDTNNLNDIVKEYDIFGRVRPEMKRELVRALKNNGDTVCMTGDGVNDVLALRESDCSVAMASGSDATKAVSQLVLLDSNFASMPKIVAEGRRNINNIERSASLLLVKTIYTFLLILTSLFFRSPYFFVPIQLTLITGTTIGIPSFILALEPNKSLVDGNNFLLKIFKKSIPASFTVFLNMIIILMFKQYFETTPSITNALAVLTTGAIGFIHLYNISKPFNYLRGVLFSFLVLAFIYGGLFQHEFFSMQEFNGQIGLIYFLLIIFSLFSYDRLTKLTNYLFSLPSKIKR